MEITFGTLSILCFISVILGLVLLLASIETRCLKLLLGLFIPVTLVSIHTISGVYYDVKSEIKEYSIKIENGVAKIECTDANLNHELKRNFKEGDVITVEKFAACTIIGVKYPQRIYVHGIEKVKLNE